MPGGTPRLKLRMFGATDKGLVRSLNQDAYSCDAQHGIAVLSDGMGGHLAGEIASHMVVEGLSEALTTVAESALEDLPARIEDSILSVNKKLLVRSQEDASCRGMGATANVLCFAHGHVTLGHVGDSRTYFLRAFTAQGGKPRFGIWQLTIDHNLGTFVDRGILALSTLSADGAMSARERAKLTRGMGVMPDPKPDIYSKKLAEGDVFLTCSDGLHGFVTDRDILRTIVAGPIAEAPQRLIESAIAAGAPDNVTVVLSVISDNDEPLRSITGPELNARPFLIRLPDGEVRGPFLAQEIIDLWTRRTLASSTEVSASLGDWVQLRNKDAVLNEFPEFKQDNFLNHIFYETTNDSIAVTGAPAESVEKKAKKRFLARTGKAVIALLGAALFAAYLYGPVFSEILLPAY